ncbi:GHMP kinase [Flavobacteriaceae bacterium]|nr:GHMP kinase [Flavobacteriaceae bacterium]
MELIISEAPARICFFGDHQDYLNLPVIAGSIDRKITVKGRPNTTHNYNIQLIDLDRVITIDLNEKFTIIEAADYYRSSMVILQREGAVFEQGYSIEITGNIPVNAGVSSSSALVVAWLRFLIQAQKNPKPVSNVQIGKWAYTAEVLFFKQPGGLMDQYTIAQGGLIYIDTQSGNSTRLTPQLGQLVIAESGIAKQTLDVLQNAREYSQNAIASVRKINPDFDIQQSKVADYARYLEAVPELYKNHWYAAIHNYDLTLKAKKALLASSVDLVQVGEWMNEHQIILQERIQNTPAKMVLQMEAARAAGALGAKIIGSGGGGCMVAMVTENTKQKVINAFLSEGAVAAYGVQLIHF